MKKSEGFFLFGNHFEMRISRWLPKEKNPSLLLHGFMVICFWQTPFTQDSGLRTQARVPTVIR